MTSSYAVVQFTVSNFSYKYSIYLRNYIISYILQYSLQVL